MKYFKPGFHDALVLDEVNLRFMGREAVIGFVDSDEDITVDVRYGMFELEPSTPRIFISNSDPRTAPLLPFDESGAIERRIKFLEICEKTWLGTPGPSVAATS